MRSKLVSTLLFSALSFSTGLARADLVVAGSGSSGGSSRASSGGGTEFYGWINILVGELSVGVVLGVAGLASLGDGGGSEVGLVGALPLLGYTFGGPIVHAVKGESFAKSLGAFGILLGTPPVGALVGYAASDGCTSNGCRGNAAAWGAVTGAAIAPLVDGLALGWGGRRGDARAGVFVAPEIRPTAGGATLGLVGAF
jgi:hypothetical protein